MIVPNFKCRQDGRFVYVYVEIKASNCRLERTEFDLSENVVIFTSPPYHLKLNLPGSVAPVEDEENCKWSSATNEFVLKLRKVNENEHFEGLDQISRLSSSVSVKSESESVNEENKSNIYEEIQNGSPSSSNSSLTRSTETLKSDRSPKSTKAVGEPGSEQKCIHQVNAECFNLSYLYLEDGSCLVCNALTVGSRELESSKSSGDTNTTLSNESAAKVVHREDANHQAAELTVKADVKKGETRRTLSNELNKLTRIGWYWGKLSRFEAEEKLIDKTPGTFLIRDSFDTNYLLSLSFKIAEGVFHTRIEHQNGQFHFYLHPNKTYETVSSLVDDLILTSQTGIYYYVRSKKSKKEVRFTIKLDQPLSRFSELKSLKHLCRFIVRESVRFDQIEQLPLPDAIKIYLAGNHL